MRLRYGPAIRSRYCEPGESNSHDAVAVAGANCLKKPSAPQPLNRAKKRLAAQCSRFVREQLKSVVMSRLLQGEQFLLGFGSASGFQKEFCEQEFVVPDKDGKA